MELKADNARLQTENMSLKARVRQLLARIETLEKNGSGKGSGRPPANSENFSREYSRKNIRSMIDEQKKQGWEFVFLGADIDAEAGCDDLSLDRRRVVGVQASFAFLADEIPQFLAGRVPGSATDDGAADEKVCWSAAFDRWQDDTKRSR